MEKDTVYGRKRAKLWTDDIDENSHNTFQSVATDSSLKNNIERKLHQTRNITEQEIDLDHILSHIPYRSLLENLFPSTSCAEATTLPIISKSYEESFMRQSRQNENPCVFGSLCECQFIDPCAAFTAVEFRLFNDSPKPQMCVLCSRRTTQKMFYDMCFSGKPTNSIIQRYGNIFGQPGEYSTECMLSCPHGLNLHCMPLPVMSHQRNKYSVVSSGGLKYLSQHRVSYEHFCPPSDTTQG